jgi:ribose/xylose/arabinose/galactoside ABC-type transport system permease subunit
LPAYEKFTSGTISDFFVVIVGIIIALLVVLCRFDKWLVITRGKIPAFIATLV